MRIAYVCTDPGVPVFGSKGSSIHVQEVVRGFARTGAEVTLFATRLGADPPSDLRGIAVHRLPSPPGDEPAARELAGLAANSALRAALAEHGPFDLIYERYALWSRDAMEHARAMGRPGILEVNAPLIEEQARHRILVHRAEAEAVATRVFAAARALVAVSPGVGAYLAEQGVEPERIHVVPNGVDPGRFRAVGPECGAEYGPTAATRADRPFTVGFLGTLKPWHGLGILLDAFARAQRDDPDRRLLIVGDGPERGMIESVAARLGIASAVVLTGAVAPHQVPARLAEMDVAVAPYPDQPGFYFSPLKIVEYMAAGLPVVASRIGDLHRIVRHEVSGLLCPPGDPGALASAIERLRRDPALCRRLGAAGREAVLAEHTWDAVVARIHDLAGLRPRHASRREGCSA
ncbi:glycosyltransferase family 4 protein [Thiocapsa sp.]|uniref:glycosyltransferase family 4 protein n=1 Tax=Thiocapsa sp. TaxID=2024551 RepID=UPI0025DB8D9F|nr:glycosyltransferase family 4 protein [Thiocapsa sp.]